MEEKTELKPDAALEPAEEAQQERARHVYAAKMFWGYLILGSLFWFFVLYGATYLFVKFLPVDETVGGFAILICAAILYLWGFVFAVLSFLAARKIKNPWWLKALYILGVILYLCALFTGMFVLIHLAVIL